MPWTTGKDKYISYSGVFIFKTINYIYIQYSIHNENKIIIISYIIHPISSHPIVIKCGEADLNIKTDIFSVLDIND